MPFGGWVEVPEIILGGSRDHMVDTTVNIVLCFGPRLELSWPKLKIIEILLFKLRVKSTHIVKPKYEF